MTDLVRLTLHKKLIELTFQEDNLLWVFYKIKAQVARVWVSYELEG